jgi:hypothetical protein
MRPIELYKCAALTAICGLLLGILLRMPARPLTLNQMRTAHMSRADMRNSIPVVFIQDGSVSVDNLNDPMPVEVQNTVDAECTISGR